MLIFGELIDNIVSNFIAFLAEGKALPLFFLVHLVQMHLADFYLMLGPPFSLRLVVEDFGVGELGGGLLAGEVFRVGVDMHWQYYR